jgi:hypothetical protein
MVESCQNPGDFLALTIQYNEFLIETIKTIPLRVHITTMSDLDGLKSIVCVIHGKIFFAMKLFKILRFLIDHPEAALCIGLIPYDQNSFLINMKYFAAFLGLKQNSCNRNFQQHMFILDKNFRISQELRDRYPAVTLSERTWRRRQFALGNFNGNSSEAEIAVATAAARSARVPWAKSLVLKSVPNRDEVPRSFPVLVRRLGRDPNQDPDKQPALALDEWGMDPDHTPHDPAMDHVFVETGEIDGDWLWLGF